MKKQKGMGSELAEAVTEHFYASEEVAFAAQEILLELQPHPLALAFAALIIDRGIAAQVKEWKDIKLAAKVSFEQMEKEGLLPTFKKDGSVKPPTTHPRSSRV